MSARAAQESVFYFSVNTDNAPREPAVYSDSRIRRTVEWRETQSQTASPPESEREKATNTHITKAHDAPAQDRKKTGTPKHFNVR